MSDRLLQLLLDYGVLALMPVLAGAALGLPLPASLLLLAAGAYAGGGQLSLPLLIASGVSSAIVGDVAGYWLGRRGGDDGLSRLGVRLKISTETIQRAEGLFWRWGGAAVFLTRFLLTPFGPVINLLAGASHYPIRMFLLFDIVGEAVWVVAYTGLGYFFSANWDVVAQFMSSATKLLAIVAFTVAVAVVLIRTMTQWHGQGGEPSRELSGTPELRVEPGEKD